MKFTLSLLFIEKNTVHGGAVGLVGDNINPVDLLRHLLPHTRNVQRIFG